MRILMSLLTALITASGLAVATAGNASALGGESLVCRVTPSHSPYFDPDCDNDMAADSYQVTFLVHNQTAQSTYAWSISASLSWTVSSGCDSTSSTCIISVPKYDNDITASVTLTQNGATETLTTRASIGLFCGSTYC